MPKRLKKKAIRKALLLVVPTPPATPSLLTKLGRLSTLHKVVSGAALATWPGGATSAPARKANKRPPTPG